jgi:hypothetical protein
VLGLAFKPNTDDMREAPSIPIITTLQQRGAIVRAYDPMAMDNAESIMPDVVYCATPYDVAKRADALLIVTEWNEFKQLNFDKLKQLMRQPVILDGRNLYDPTVMAERGFVYQGIGRGTSKQEHLQYLSLTAPHISYTVQAKTPDEAVSSTSQQRIVSGEADAHVPRATNQQD